MTSTVRQPIDVVSLEEYICKKVPEIKGPISVQQFGYGQSNPTYKLTTTDSHHYVLRKKPPGELISKTAHQIEREYRIIHALSKTDVSVPKVYWLCEDETIIGTPFYIMEFLDGRIFEDPSMPGATPIERREMWYDAVRTLAKLHRVKPADIGLQTFVKQPEFYDRQIETFGKICRAQAEITDRETGERVGEIPHLDDMLRYFAEKKTQPRDRSNLIHGDFKIDNLVFHKTEPKVLVILDWEMSTIGHPLSDLATLTTPFTLGTHKLPPNLPLALLQAAATPGLPTLDELTLLYAHNTGWDPRQDLAWGVAFGLFRMTAICQGIASRFAQRQASSAKAKENAEARHPIAALAWQQVLENISSVTSTSYL